MLLQPRLQSPFGLSDVDLAAAAGDTTSRLPSLLLLSSVRKPTLAGMSEDIRRVCRKFNIRVVFKSGRTLRSMLTKVKDTLPPGKQSNVVYRIPAAAENKSCW